MIDRRGERLFTAQTPVLQTRASCLVACHTHRDDFAKLAPRFNGTQGLVGSGTLETGMPSGGAGLRGSFAVITVLKLSSRYMPTDQERDCRLKTMAILF